MQRFAAFLTAFLLMTSAEAATYQVVPEKSSIAFRGTHAAEPFSGSFTKWTATIQFDPANLNTSRLEVTIDTASATTGNKMYDGTLPSADWFDAKKFPQARFVSTRIEKTADGSFIATGDLTIRDVTLPITLPFTLTPADAATPHVRANASVTLDRLAFKIGAQSDANAEWVGREIAVTITLEADAK